MVDPSCVTCKCDAGSGGFSQPEVDDTVIWVRGNKLPVRGSRNGGNWGCIWWESLKPVPMPVPVPVIYPSTESKSSSSPSDSKVVASHSRTSSLNEPEAKRLPTGLN